MIDDEKAEIVAYEDKYKEVFCRLNTNWITEHWQLEPHDLEIFANPHDSIIAKGGFIFVALYEGVAAGVCALCKTDDGIYDYEIAKLAVDNAYKGKKLGLYLCEACINKAKEMGAKKIFLESNTRLTPAINLYKKLGFQQLPELHNAYSRGDIQMVLDI